MHDLSTQQRVKKNKLGVNLILNMRLTSLRYQKSNNMSDSNKTVLSIDAKIC
jgi:hypothetical protein